jgi:hypothetical protein
MVVSSAVSSQAAEHGWISMFDGKSLTGWGGTDMSYWSVQDGLLTGEVTKDHPSEHSYWLQWQGEQVGDFEMKAKFKISGDDLANSGIQFRSTFTENGTHANGYQADITLGPNWVGLLYDEGTGRTFIAMRGEKAVVDEDGKKTITKIGDSDALYQIFRRDDWNDYTVIARGHDLKAIINGHLMSEVIDNDKKNFHPTGWIALQIHHGTIMKVQFKDIFLKKYN